MKQVVQSYRTGKLTLSEVPAPALRPGGILVRNAASVISPGTERSMMDMARKSLVQKALERPDLVQQVLNKARREGVISTVQAVMSRLDAPVSLGYSSAGVVLEVGEGAEEFKPGEAVACGGAGYAAHASVIFVPRNLAVKMPLRGTAGNLPQEPSNTIPFEEAAFTTIGAIALQGVRTADVRLDEVVAVIGLGLIGLLTVQLLKANGCRVLGMDVNPARCQLARQLGADAAATDKASLVNRSLELTGGHGVDAVLITAATKSNEPVRLAAELCREKGRVVVVGAVGMDLPRPPFYEKELELRLSRSYGPGRYDVLYEEKGIDYPYGYVRWTEQRNMAAFLDLVAMRKMQLQPLITHRFPIDRALEAYELIADDRAGEALGVVLTYPESEPAFAKLGLQSLRTGRLETGLKPSAPQQVTIGFIGAGNFAKAVLLPKLRKREAVDLKTLCTASGLIARQAGEKFGFAECTTDAEAIFKDPAINAVFVATPHNLHATLAIQALKAGKNVFVEKPLALKEEELRDIVQAYWEASQSGASPILMVGFNRRFAPLTRRIKDFFSPLRSPLAVHYRINAGVLPPGHWMRNPEEGGRIVGEVCHFVDWIQYLVGASPAKVYAQALPEGGCYQPEDNVAISLTFADGSIGTIHYLANGDSRVPKERIEVFGGGAVAVIEDFRSGYIVRGGKRQRLGRRLMPVQDKGHSAELAAFIAAVRQGNPSPIPLKEAIATTRSTFAIRESLRLGVPVNLSGNEG